MQQAIDAYRHVSATDEFRELERIRSKARHDEAQAIYDAEQRGKIEGKKEEAFFVAQKALQMNYPIEDIVILTGLTLEEIERLH